MRTRVVSRLGFFLTCLAICQLISATEYFYLNDFCRGNSRYSSSATLRVGSPSAGHNSSGILKFRNYGSHFSSWSCTLHLDPPSDHGIIVSFKEVTFRTGCVDSLKFTDSYGDRKAYFCNNVKNDEERISYSSEGRATLAISIGRGDVYFSNSGFQLTFTAFRKGKCYSNTDFQCDNKRCISKLLTCDGHNHCGDRSDQAQCKTPIIPVICGVLGGIFSIVAVVSGIICCRNGKKKTSTNRVYPPSQPLPPSERQTPSIQPQNIAYPPPPYAITNQTMLQHPCAVNIPYPQQQNSEVNNPYPLQPYAMNYPYAPQMSYPSAPPSSMPSPQSQYMEQYVTNEKDNLAYK